MEYYLEHLDFAVLMEVLEIGGPILIGEESFGWFYPDTGWDTLVMIADEEPDMLFGTSIRQSNGKTITVQDFLDKFTKKGLKMRRRMT